MASGGSSPTVRRLELGRRLRELRVAAGRGPSQVAAELECSTAKISRMESGQRAATALDVKVLARYYALSEAERDELMALAAEARKRGWWHDYRTLDDQARTYLGLESAASSMFQVEVVRVPGLLQTVDYATALVPRLRPPGFWAGGTAVTDILNLRRHRRERLLSGDLQYEAVVDEAALHRKLGPPKVMLDQLRHLMEMARLPNVTVQITTFDVGSHPGLDEPFALLRFPDAVIPDVVFVEGLAGNHVLQGDEQPTVLDAFRDAARHMSQEVALSPEETMAWLERFLAERSTETGNRQ